MSSIRKRNGRYQAQVRRRGYSPTSRTFTNLATANKWIKSVEVDLERGEFLPRVTMTVDELLLRYEAEEVPKQKGARHEFWRSSSSGSASRPTGRSRLFISIPPYLLTTIEIHPEQMHRTGIGFNGALNRFDFQSE